MVYRLPLKAYVRDSPPPEFGTERGERRQQWRDRDSQDQRQRARHQRPSQRNSQGVAGPQHPSPVCGHTKPARRQRKRGGPSQTGGNERSKN